jgi:putative membrane protein
MAPPDPTTPGPQTSEETGIRMRQINRLIAYLVAGLLAVLIAGMISQERLIGYDDRESVLVFALILGAINAYIRPVIQLLTLPISCLTFGLFSVVVNAALFGLAAALVPGITVTILGALVGAVITSVLSGIIFSILDEK